MITKIEINKLEDLLDLLKDQELDNGIGRYRSSYIYRGLSDASYNLETSLKRNCKDKQNELEKCIIRNFVKYAETNQLNFNSSIWEQIMLGQHHGLPTRMLDWTFSPLVAIHFACNKDNLNEINEKDCCIWKVDINELKGLLPNKYVIQLNSKNAIVYTADMLSEIATLDEYDSDMSDSAMVLIEPPSIDQRIINQYSVFSVIPINMASIEEFLEKYTINTVKYIINKELKWRIRDMLDQMNINERIMYPGLDGLSLWLKRHYFVKEIKNV